MVFPENKRGQRRVSRILIGGLYLDTCDVIQKAINVYIKKWFTFANDSQYNQVKKNVLASSFCKTDYRNV